MLVDVTQAETAVFCQEFNKVRARVLAEESGRFAMQFVPTS
jgi:hypothetical protein